MDKGEFLQILRNSGKAIVGRVSIDCDQIQKFIYFGQSHQLLLPCYILLEMPLKVLAYL